MLLYFGRRLPILAGTPFWPVPFKNMTRGQNVFIVANIEQMRVQNFGRATILAAVGEMQQVVKTILAVP